MAHLTDDQTALLATYLDDHWAGAGGGSELAERLASNNVDTEWGARLEQLASDVREDEAVLSKVRDALDFDGGDIKRLAAVIGEKAARLKPNHRAASYSPLSRILELEAMAVGVVGKQRLWSTILDSQVHQLSSLTSFDFPALLARATEQLSILADVHRDAARVAFGEPTDVGTDGPSTTGAA